MVKSEDLSSIQAISRGLRAHCFHQPVEGTGCSILPWAIVRCRFAATRTGHRSETDVQPAFELRTVLHLSLISHLSWRDRARAPVVQGLRAMRTNGGRLVFVLRFEFSPVVIVSTTTWLVHVLFSHVSNRTVFVDGAKVRLPS